MTQAQLRPFSGSAIPGDEMAKAFKDDSASVLLHQPQAQFGKM